MSNVGGSLDVRVVRWRVNNAVTALGSRTDIVTGMPVNTTGQTGRHSGCRIRFGPDGNLWVGTGDAATGTVPQNPTSLGGKVLRVNTDGQGVPGNAKPPFDPRIYTYGHRNVQGIAFDKDGRAFSIEHGTGRDDEVNRLVAGANYGWDPVPPGGGAGYDESQPMTDFTKFPNARKAVWSSGNPTIAPSGGTFLNGSQWAGWDGALAMAVQKDQHLRVLALTSGKNAVEPAVGPDHRSGPHPRGRAGSRRQPLPGHRRRPRRDPQGDPDALTPAARAVRCGGGGLRRRGGRGPCAR